MKASEKRIVARLLSKGMLDEPKLEALLARYDGTVPLPKLLVAQGLVNSAQLTQAEAEEAGFPYVSLAGVNPPQAALAALDEATCWNHLIVPFATDQEELHIAIANPNDVLAQDALKHLVRQPIRFHVAEHQDVIDALCRLYGESAVRQDIDTLEKKKYGQKKEIADASTAEDAGVSHRMYQRRMRQLRENGSEYRKAGISQLDTRIGTNTDHSAEVYSASTRRDDSRHAELRPFGRRLNQLIWESHSNHVEELDFLPQEADVALRLCAGGIWRTDQRISTDEYQVLLTEVIDRIAGSGLGMHGQTRSLIFTREQPPLTVVATAVLSNTIHGRRFTLRIGTRTALFSNPFVKLGISRELTNRLKQRLAGRGGLFLIAAPQATSALKVYESLCREFAGASNRPGASLQPATEAPLANLATHCYTNEAEYHAALDTMETLQPGFLALAELPTSKALKTALRLAGRGTTVIASTTAPSASGLIDALEVGCADRFLLARSLAGILFTEEVARLCPHCAAEIADRETLPSWAREIDVPFYEAIGCAECHQTGYQGTTFLSDFLLPSDDAAEPLQPAVDRSRDVISLSIAGEIDPRNHPLQ